MKRISKSVTAVFGVTLGLFVARFSPTTSVFAQEPSDAAALKRTIEDLDSRMERQHQELQTLQELVAKNGQAITSAQTQAFSQIDRLVPIGTILPYYGKLDALPSNWVLCDGRDSPGLPYPWTKIPNLQQRFLRGAQDGSGADTALGAGGGQDTIPNHHHTVFGSSNDVSFPQKSVTDWVGGWQPVTSAANAQYDGTKAELVIPFNATEGPVESHGHIGGSATFTGQTSYDGVGDNRPAFTSVYFVIRVR